MVAEEEQTWRGGEVMVDRERGTGEGMEGARVISE